MEDGRYPSGFRKIERFGKIMEYSLAQLQKKARLIRQDVIKMLVRAGSGHPAGSLGLADVFTALYFSILNYHSEKPDWPERDRFVLSCGHVCPVYYAAMARAGFFPIKELLTLRQFGSRLQGHPHNLALPGVEASSGPLGQGISQAIGMALAGRLERAGWRAVCLMSDGEQQEGQTWEALMFAGKEKLNNLTAIVDRNNIQISGPIEEVMPLEPLRKKYQAFGWHVLEINGHSFEEIIEAFAQAKSVWGKPTIIIAHTIAGKGVSFMENLPEWHGKAPTPQEAEKALKELGIRLQEIRG